MAWELAAIWLIVAATIVWFVRDEGRRRLGRLTEQARVYATASSWQHREAAGPISAAQPGREALTDIQRKFGEEMRRQRLERHI